MPFNICKRKLHDFISDERFAGILRGSAWVLGGQSISALLGLLTSVLVARLYGPEVMGTVAVITSLLTLLSLVTVLGMDTSILRLLPEHLVKYSPTSAQAVFKKTALMVTGISIGAGLLLFLGSSILADKVFGKPQLAPYLALAAPFVLFNSLKSLNTQAVRGLFKIRHYAFLLVLPPFANLLFLLLLISFSFRPADPLYSLFSSLFWSAFIGWVILRISFKGMVKTEELVQPTSCKSILDISLPMLVTNALYFFIGQSGTMILGIYQPEEQIGYYDTAVKLSSLVAFFFSAIISVVAPRFSELFHNGKTAELLYVARKAARLIFWTTTPILLFLLVLGKPLLGSFFGPKFIQSYPPLVILVAGQFINTASGATAYFMYMTGKEKVLRNCTIITTIITLGLSFSLIPTFGIIGAALAAAVGIAFLNGLLLLYTKKEYGRSTGYFPFFSSRS